MNELVQKVSSYNIFNYLFPGVLFVGLLPYITSYNFIQDDFFIAIFVYYFIGLCISRAGSLIIEPLLKVTSFIKFFDYGDLISASLKDPKLELFSEVNNTYRTICALFISLLFFRVYQILENTITAIHDQGVYVLAVILIILFFFSYKKQTTYINKRIKHHL